MLKNTRKEQQMRQPNRVPGVLVLQKLGRLFPRRPLSLLVALVDDESKGVSYQQASLLCRVFGVRCYATVPWAWARARV